MILRGLSPKGGLRMQRFHFSPDKTATRARAATLCIGLITAAILTSHSPAADSTPGASAAAAPADTRLPVPSDAAQKISAMEISATVARDRPSARLPAQKTALAKKLIGLAGDESNAGNHYVLLTTARDLAVEAGDLATAYAAIDALDGAFAVDGSALKVQATVAVSKTLRAPADRTHFLGIAWSAIDDAMVAEKYASAEQICRTFIRIAEISDTDQVTKGNARLAQIRQSASIDAGVATSRPAAAVDSAASPEETLASRGLAKSGFLYLLDADVKLADAQRTVRMERNHMEADNTHRTQLQRQVKAAKADVELQHATWNQMVAQLKTMPRAYATYNVQVEKVNAQLERWEKADAYLKDRQTALDGMLDTRNKYTDALVAFSNTLEQAQEQYETLAKDPSVASALSALSTKGGTTPKLGPSAPFKEALAWSRQQRQWVRSQAIPFKLEGGVPAVDVLLNGEVTERMILDSGAASILLNAEVAKKLGIVPGPGTPTEEFVAADGKHSTAFVESLHSVRLGEFSVENVECVVLPPDVHADCLLGGPFLRNFIVKLDIAGGVVNLSQLKDDKAK